MRPRHALGFLAKRHSQIVKTVQPARRKALAVRRSRRWFLTIFVRHAAAFVRGTRFRPQRCPCQKQPCRNTATRWCGQVKSGRPTTETCRLQPCIPDSRRRASRRSSVVAFPLLRTRAIKADRDSPPKVVRCSLGLPVLTTMASDRVRCIRDDLFREERGHSIPDHFEHEIDLVCGKPERSGKRL